MKLDLYREAERHSISQLDLRSVRMTKDRTLLVFISCRAWWLDGAAGQNETIATLEFINTSGGNLDLNGLFGQEGENTYFRIEPSSNLDWTTGSQSKIYCNSSIPYPSSILLDIEKALVDADCPMDPLDCVAGAPAGTMAGFTRLAKQGNFLLCDSPPRQVYNAILAQLKSQKVDHTVLESNARSAKRYCVWIGNSWFHCDSAALVARYAREKSENQAIDPAPEQALAS